MHNRASGEINALMLASAFKRRSFIRPRPKPICGQSGNRPMNIQRCKIRMAENFMRLAIAPMMSKVYNRELTLILE